MGSIRRECLNDVIVLNEGHLRRILRSYGSYDHSWRVHWSCDVIGWRNDKSRVTEEPPYPSLNHLV
jgi:hypothetical protein